MPADAFGQDAESFASRWQFTVNQETRVSGWKGSSGFPGSATTAGGSGTQLYVPLSVQAVGNPNDNTKLELLARGGYVYSRQSTPGQTGYVSTQTDTVLSGTLTLLNFQGFQPFVSANVNLPTGKPALFGSSANARMDPDFVDIASFGEGWNVGPTIGTNIALSDSLMVTLGAGYTNRFAYTREGAIDTKTGRQGTTRIDPGNAITLNASLGYDATPISVQVSASYSTESTSYLDHNPSFRAGDRYSVSGTLGYTWRADMTTTVNGSWSHGKRNTIKSESGNAFIPERFNSNSDVFRVQVEQAFSKDNWTVSPFGNWMKRDTNSYNPPTYQFVPAKTRWGAGVNVTHSSGNALTLRGSFERIWVREDESPDRILTDPKFGTTGVWPGSGIPDLTYAGWLMALNATLNF